jgi:hypothetical protein
MLCGLSHGVKNGKASASSGRSARRGSQPKAIRHSAGPGSHCASHVKYSVISTAKRGSRQTYLLAARREVAVELGAWAPSRLASDSRKPIPDQGSNEPIVLVKAVAQQRDRIAPEVEHQDAAPLGPSKESSRLHRWSLGPAGDRRAVCRCAATQRMSPFGKELCLSCWGVRRHGQRYPGKYLTRKGS